MPEAAGCWSRISDGPNVVEQARNNGAMYLTCLAVNGDPHGEPPPDRRGDMHLDHDDKENPALVFDEMLKVVGHLHEVYGVDPHQLELFLSGEKGGHVIIKSDIIGIEPGPYLHLEQKMFACKLAADLGLKTLDLKIYSGGKGRQFRLPNVKRKNGRYKVPVMLSELAGLSINDFLELTKAKRELDPDEQPLEPTKSDTLNELFLSFRDQVRKEQAAAKDHKPLDVGTVNKLKNELPDCINAIIRLNQKPAKGNFNEICLNLASYFHAIGTDLGSALSSVEPLLENYSSNSYPTRDKREKHFRQMFNYTDGHPSYKFGCSFILGLGLPGSAFECGHCVIFINQQKETLEKRTIPKVMPKANNLGLTLNNIINYAYDGQKGCADLFIKLNLGNFCFDHTDGVWFEFCGHHWKPEDIGKPIRALDQVQAIFESAQSGIDGEIIIQGQQLKQATNGTEKEKLKIKNDSLEAQSKKIGEIVRKLNNLAFRKQVVEFSAQGPDSLGITGTEWDLLPWALGVQNGVINLGTGQIRDGKPGDHLRAVGPIHYDPAATCPEYEQALMDIFNSNQEMVKFVNRLFGMAIVGINIEHVLIVLCGAGRNGKDVLLSTIGHVLGPALAGPVQSELLLDQGRLRSSSGPNADIMRLRGLRIAWASETNEGRRLDAGKIKLMTGGGDLVGRAPYARCEISFPQSFTLFLLTNSKPHAPAEDYALWKRLKLIPFEVQFVDDPKEMNERMRDKHLLDKLKAEAPGILNWLIRGCLEWQRIGLDPPEEVERATMEYRDEEDLLLQFVNDACLTGPEFMAGASELYDHYRKWMLDNGLKPMSGTKFGRKMGERYHKDKDRGGWNYQGIGILNNNVTSF